MGLPLNGEKTGFLPGNSGGAMKALVKVGREQRMQDPHEKARAHQLDPESRAGAGNREGEALTGAHAGCHGFPK